MKDLLMAGAFAVGGSAAEETPVEVANNAAAEEAAGAGCNSFPGSTPVLMADGTAKPIDQVKVGDEVENAAPDSDLLQRHTVTTIHITDDDRDFVDLAIATPAGPRPLTATAHHLFWDVTIGDWTAAADLKPGDQLDTLDNHRAAVVSSMRYATGLRTYNLTIDTVHTYYVFAGGTPVLVHNCGSSDLDVWQVQDRIDEHVLPLHGYGTDSVGSKFGEDISRDDITNMVHDGVGGPITKRNEDGLGHFHEWDTGRTIGTVNGQATSRIGIWITPGANGAWELGTVYPI